MSVTDVILILTLLAGGGSVLAGVLRGTADRRNAGVNSSPFALVGPTLADSAALERLIESNIRVAGALERIATLGETEASEQAKKLTELLQKLTEEERSPRKR